MRIYSDKILAWNEVLHAAYAARVNPGRWLNTHVYKIKRIQPTIIHTFSPIEFLEKDRKYYLYDNLLRNKACDHLPNFIDIVEGINGRMFLFNNDCKIYLPLTVAVGDVLLIHEDVGGHGEQIILA
jgi:hypothetical protein